MSNAQKDTTQSTAQTEHTFQGFVYFAKKNHILKKHKTRFIQAQSPSAYFHVIIYHKNMR